MVICSLRSSNLPIDWILYYRPSWVMHWHCELFAYHLSKKYYWTHYDHLEDQWMCLALKLSDDVCTVRMILK